MTTKRVSVSRVSRLALPLCLSLIAGIGVLVIGGVRSLAPAAKARATNGGHASTARLKEKLASLPLAFEPNQGETDGRVKFLARGNGYGIFLTRDAAVLKLERPSRARSSREPMASEGASVLRMRLAGMNPDAEARGLDELPGKSNYFIGRDPSRWRTNVPNYARVEYSGVYPGVDLVYYGNQQQLEYDFVAEPGADPSVIRLAFDRVVGAGSGESGVGQSKIGNRKSDVPYSLFATAHSLRVAPNGDLTIHASSGDVVFRKPVVYQSRAGAGSPGRKYLDGRYVVRGNRVSFDVPSYDRSKPLVIDPTLTYSTYLGGSMDDFANGVTVLADEAYVTGQTFSTDFPVVLSAEQSACNGCSFGLSDAFVTKLNAAGSAIVYSTFLGGSNSDVGAAIAVDSLGDAYVAGTTFSVDFPVKNPFQSTFGGFEDAFVTKLDPAGSALIYSTYLGGSQVDEAFGIALDNTVNCVPAGSCAAYVAGATNSTNFPTLDPFQAALAGGSGFDAFVTKLNASGSSLVYSTYLGGNSEDKAFAIAVDTSSNAYITGHTFSNNFPTMNAFRSAFGGVTDAFVTKLNFASSKLTLAYSSYLGGTGIDEGFGIALDSSQNVYVTGETQSPDFPTTTGAFQTVYGGAQDAFVTKLKSDGSALVYSTYLGGSGKDQGSAIAVDSTGKANVVGFTLSGTTGSPNAPGSFPTANPIQTAGYAGNQDAFITRLVPSGCGLGFSTYLGGKSTDQAMGVALDVNGNAFITGFTLSNDFPFSASPVQSATAGGNDAFVSEISAATAPAVCLSPSTLTFNPQTATTTSASQNITLTNGGDAALSITSIMAAGPYMETNTCGSSVAAGANCTISVTFTPQVAGTQPGLITIMDNAGGVPCQANSSLTCHAVALTGVGTDFGMSANPSTASVSQGQSATYTVTITPSLDFTTPVALTCSISPALAPGGCSVSPTTVTPSGTTPQMSTLTLTTVKGSMVGPWGPETLPPKSLRLPLLVGVLALLAASVLGGRLGRQHGRLGWVRLALPFSAVLLLVLMWAACGVGSSTPSSTPPGTYNVTVTGTAGTLVHSIRVGLTVQ